MRAAPVILGYHGIADVDPRHDPIRLFVRPRDLRRQVERLRSRGYRFLTAADFARELAGGRDMARTCALTFDDGTEDHLTILAPLLEQLGVPGTVYVCPGLFGDPYPWCDPAAGVRLMTSDEVVELARHPLVEIGSHTIHHTVLAEASAEEAYREMATCKERLEELLGPARPELLLPALRLLPRVPRRRPPRRLHERGDVRPARQLGSLRAQARVRSHARRPADLRAEVARRSTTRIRDHAAGSARALGHPPATGTEPNARRRYSRHVGHAGNRPDEPLEQLRVGREVTTHPLDELRSRPLVHPVVATRLALVQPVRDASQPGAGACLRRLGQRVPVCRSPGVSLTTRGPAASARNAPAGAAHLVADAEIGRDVTIVHAEEAKQVARAAPSAPAQHRHRADEQLLAREEAQIGLEDAPVLAGDDVLVAVGGPDARRLERLGASSSSSASSSERPSSPSTAVCQ